ncbi:MAG: thioredoxin TrxC [Psychromonas sp.]
MTTFTSRCPHCLSMNRLPIARIDASANCGKCKRPLLQGLPVEGTSTNLQALINSDTPVVIDFWAPWCNPCIGFAPVFSEIAKQESQGLRFVKVDTEAQQQIAAQYKIRSIPTLMVFKKGRLLDSINGALPKQQFKQWLATALTK